jgi:hypothetical protein
LTQGGGHGNVAARGPLRRLSLASGSAGIVRAEKAFREHIPRRFRGKIMSGRSLALGVAFAAVMAVLPGSGARAANWVEENFYLSGPRYDGVLPPCDAQAALGKIASRFGDKEHAYWNSKLTVAGFDQVREVAYRPWAANTIPRRFCSAVVYISDGSKHMLHYAIAEDSGMIGGTWGVEWCVVGLDRNWAYNPACSLAEP